MKNKKFRNNDLGILFENSCRCPPTIILICQLIMVRNYLQQCESKCLFCNFFPKYQQTTRKMTYYKRSKKPRRDFEKLCSSVHIKLFLPFPFYLPSFLSINNRMLKIKCSSIPSLPKPIQYKKSQRVPMKLHFGSLRFSPQNPKCHSQGVPKYYVLDSTKRE